MSDEKFDSLIRRSLRSAGEEEAMPAYRAGRPPCGFLSDEDIADYVTKVAAGGQPQESMVEHALSCDACFSKIASSVSALSGFGKNPSPGGRYLIDRVKSIPKIYPKAKNAQHGRNSYLFVSAVFFILSFIFKRYFAQFLAACVIFGFKWVMDTGGSRALIMIYDTWQKKKDSGSGSGERNIFAKDKRNT